MFVWKVDCDLIVVVDVFVVFRVVVKDGINIMILLIVVVKVGVIIGEWV